MTQKLNIDNGIQDSKTEHQAVINTGRIINGTNSCLKFMLYGANIRKVFFLMVRILYKDCIFKIRNL